MNHALLMALAIALVVTVTPTRQLQAQSTKLQTDNIDFEVARVRKQLRDIQEQPIAHDVKIQQQRALIERESARARAQMREIELSIAKNDSFSDSKKGGTGTSKDIRSRDTSPRDTSSRDTSSRDRRKAAMDNIQKFLDIIRSMNPSL
jgi:hypothetical protein